jgi:excisionase family DNA binding protein
MEKLWTTSEAAAFLGIEEPQVERLVREGKLTGYRLGGQFLRFRPDQVQALKGALRPIAGTRTARGPRSRSSFANLREFLYFYDFYVVSAALLVVTVVYLLLAG